MKATLLFTLLTLGAAAQSYTYKIQSYINGNQGPMNGVPGDLITSTITFSNSSSASIQVFIDRYEKSIAPYWTLCYCYIQCHSPADDTVTVDVQPFSTTDVTLAFKTDSVNPGISTASFKIYQKGLPIVTDTVKMTASTSGAVGLKEISPSSHYLVYPIPAANHLTIQAEQVIEKITLKDLTGKIVYSNSVQSETTTLDLTNINSGVYLLEILSKESTFIQKLVKP